VMNDSYTMFSQVPIIPVIAIQHLEDAVPLAEALVAGGLTTLEVTLRTDCAAAAMKAIANQVEGAVLGAGTVTTESQFHEVVDSGARFVVSPGHNDELFKASGDTGIPLLPGAVTASEIMRVIAAGFPIVKFFPAATSGGHQAIEAFRGPFPSVKFIPTGGVNPKNLASYLSLSNVVAAGGSWMLPATLVQNKDWPGITRLATEACNLATSLLTPEESKL